MAARSAELGVAAALAAATLEMRTGRSRPVLRVSRGAPRRDGGSMSARAIDVTTLARGPRLAQRPITADARARSVQAGSAGAGDPPAPGAAPEPNASPNGAATTGPDASIAAPTEEPRLDDRLLAAAAAGDQTAARTLIDRHSGRVLALARRLLGDAAEAEDVTQEAMLRAWRAAATWTPGGARFSTWLHRVALNLCYDRLRKKRPQPLEDAPEPEDPARSVAATLVADEEGAALRAAMAELPERQREAIVMRHFEELSNPEIAEALGVSVEAVESLLARGRRALRKALAGLRDP